MLIDLIAAIFAGIFLANSVPHFVQGISGNKFPTPFSKPPGRGLSSPLVNVLWALLNVAIGYALLKVGHVHTGSVPLLIAFFIGAAGMSVMTSIQFAKKEKE